MAQPLPSNLMSAMRLVRSDHQIDLHPVAAERIVALAHMGCAFQRPEMARMPRMVEDHFLIKFAQTVIHARQPNMSRALASAATSASTSARVL